MRHDLPPPFPAVSPSSSAPRRLVGADEIGRRQGGGQRATEQGLSSSHPAGSLDSEAPPAAARSRRRERRASKGGDRHDAANASVGVMSSGIVTVLAKCSACLALLLLSAASRARPGRGRKLVSAKRSSFAGSARGLSPRRAS